MGLKEEADMKRYKYRNGPNRLLETKVWKLGDEGEFGLVVLETDHGFVEFAVNSKVAISLSKALEEFLAGKGEKFPR